ncbi:hypothetical protein [Hymenobacter metallicola]|uniref:Uncharacterized protein n=1 Tax=Hymenobacter metallicola TaxID=2563114 RepID=A0A4Z0QJZ2_9BACT|nr:hypothetical protein [Hymenobacter metallicola]TGE29022.1 hypothetical protein E5K02_06075 [Hymenobacter metallicola]
MSSNLDYLDPALIPLEDKVKAYLEAEEDLRKAIVEAKSLPNTAASEAQANQAFDHRPATGSFDQHADEVEQRIQNLQDDLQLLRQEIIGLLPTRNEFVKVNLGYGPSRVGAFAVDHGGQAAAEPQYELRIVH